MTFGQHYRDESRTNKNAESSSKKELKKNGFDAIAVAGCLAESLASRPCHALFLCPRHGIAIYARRNAGGRTWRGGGAAKEKDWNGLYAPWRKYQGPRGGAAGCRTLSRSTKTHQRKRSTSR